jgi:hypothetical protein
VTVRLFACTLSPAGNTAVFATFARLIATPAPIVTDVPLVADPSAEAAASVFADDATVTRPPDVNTTFVPTNDANELVVARLIPTAAATLTLPPDVDADGVVVVPEPFPPFAVAVLSALERSPAT